MNPKIPFILLLLTNINADRLSEYNEVYPDYMSQTVQKGNYISPQVHDQSDGQSDDQSGSQSGFVDLSEHTVVTDSYVFPYMAAIMKGSSYLSSGALIDEKWVLTSADGLFLVRDSIRFIRVRLGSINYKKGGQLLPVKMLEIHPYFDDTKPNFDLALLMLATPVRFTLNLRSIKLQMTPTKTSAAHFTVTSWTGPLESKDNTTHVKSMEVIKRHRILTVTHLHPTDLEECSIELMELETANDGILCLDAALKDPCMREVGAPVVLNNVLWAIVSSWKPDDCEDIPGSVFASRVSTPNITSWIHAVLHGHKWLPMSY